MAYELRGTLYGTNLTTVWVDDAGRISHAPIEGAEVLEGHVLPGLVDSHCHIGLAEDPQSITIADMVRRGAIVLSTGVTAVRELGAPVSSRPADAQGVMPLVIRAGTHLALPKRYFRGFAIELEDAADLPTAIVHQMPRGDNWVKLVGDWIDRAEGDLRPLWPREILIDAVAAAHEIGMKVAVHTFARETIDDLLEAGVDDIEHGTGMTRDHMIEARDRGILITPTMVQVSNFIKFAEQALPKYPVYAQRMKAMWDERDEHVRMHEEVGSHLLMGGDSGGTLPFGNFPAELRECMRAGLSVETVMAAASWKGRAALDLPTWEEGESADFTIYAQAPGPDLPDKPAYVLRGGQLIVRDGLMRMCQTTPSPR